MQSLGSWLCCVRICSRVGSGLLLLLALLGWLPDSAHAISSLTGALNVTGPALTNQSKMAAPAEVVLAPGDLDGDTTLTKENNPYRVTGIINVPAGSTLTVEEGVIILFESNTGLVINGTIIATGTAAEPVTFSATTPTPGWWRGIRMQGTPSQPLVDSTLEHVIIEYGGGPISYASNLYLESTSLTVEHSVFRHGSHDGIYGFNGGSAQIANSHFEDNAGYAIYLTDLTLDPVLQGLTATGNGGNGVALADGDITGDQLWEYPGIPYIAAESTSIEAESSLTLAPKVEVRFAENRQLDVRGILTATGTVTDPVRFTGLTAQPGWWRGISVNGLPQAHALATFDHVIVEHGGRQEGEANLATRHATVVVRHSLFNQSGRSGIRFGSGSAATISDSSFTANTEYPLFLADAAPSQYLSNLTLSGNGMDGVGVGGNLFGEHLWQAIGYPYIVDTSVLVRIDSRLTIEPGVEVRFAQGTGLEVQGNLTAVGSELAPIRFSGTTAQAGWWQGIELTRQDARLFLENCEIAYGGSTSLNKRLLFTGIGRALIQKCYIHHSQTTGIQTSNGARLFLRNNRIEQNGLGVHNTLAIRTSLDARGNWWGHESGPYHPTLNPNGQGDEVSDGVIFDPWLRSPQEETPSELILNVLGPETFAPGSIRYYALSYANTTGTTVQNTVLMAILPANAVYINIGAINYGDINHGSGIHWPERHELFWKLGELAPGETGLIVFSVKYDLGVPDNLQDSVLAYLGGSNTGPTNFDVAPYLAYGPRTILSEVELSQAQVDEERQANAELDQLYQQAIADGFVFSIASRASLSTGDQLTRILLLRFKPRFVFTLLLRQGNDALAFVADAGSLTFHRVGGAARYDLQMGGWAPIASRDATLAAEGAAWSECVKRCVIKKIPDKVIKKISKTASTISKAYDCVKAANGSGIAIAKCGNAVYKEVAKELPGVGEGIDVFECETDCTECTESCDDARCHCCTEDKFMCNDGGFPYWGLHTIEKYVCDTETGRYKTVLGFLASTTVQVCALCDKCVISNNSAMCVNKQAGTSSTQADAPFAQIVWESTEPANLTAVAANPNSKCNKCRVPKDPNTKEGVEGDLVPGQLITYTINYENIGAAEAYDVFILDILSEHFDDSTLTLYGDADYVAASRTLFWNAGTLSPKGEPAASGVVSFTVRLKEGLPSGTVITNQAVVHFPTVPEETPTNTVINIIQPLAATPQQVETVAENPVAIHLAGVDAAGAALTYALLDEPLYGTLAGNVPNLAYTPGAGFVGLDHFSFTVSNGVTTSRPALVTILVQPSPSDTSAPTVEWTSPGANESVIALPDAPFNGENGLVYAPILLVQFSEAMDAASLISTTVQVRDEAGQLLKTATNYEAQSYQWAILLQEPLQEGSRYTVTINRNAKDAAGNPLAAEVSWQFFAGDQAGAGGAFLPFLNK